VIAEIRSASALAATEGLRTARTIAERRDERDQRVSRRIRSCVGAAELGDRCSRFGGRERGARVDRNRAGHQADRA
jgi:hypothetical protein